MAAPQPCVRCNDWLKFGKLHDYARQLGASHVASGHHARIEHVDDSPRLRMGADPGKDQSYVLFGGKREQLHEMLLPIGQYTKDEIRSLALELGLPVHDKPDSQEICFVPDDDYAGLVARSTPDAVQEGEILDLEGNVVGTHPGHQHYTVGQRRGLGISVGLPIYVVNKDADKNTVTVGPRQSLASIGCSADESNWHVDPWNEPRPCMAKIRYNAAPVPARVMATGEHRIEVVFDEPQDAVARVRPWSATTMNWSSAADGFEKRCRTDERRHGLVAPLRHAANAGLRSQCRGHQPAAGRHCGPGHPSRRWQCRRRRHRRRHGPDRRRAMFQRYRRRRLRHRARWHSPPWPQCLRSLHAWSLDRFDGHEHMPTLGWEAVTIPGAVSGWAALSERFGRMPMPRLVEAAAHYARDGFPVSPQAAASWAHARRHATPAARTGCRPSRPDGRTPRPGERFACPAQATTLEVIAASNGEDFYRGDLANRIVHAASEAEAAVTLEDLSTHEPMWVEPLSMPYRDRTLHELPPNGQGLVPLVAAGLLDRFDVSALTPDDPALLHLQIEAVKHAFAVCKPELGCPDTMRRAPDTLLDPTLLDSIASTIDPDTAHDPGHVVVTDASTVYLSVADAEGMMVSYIQSNYMGFGSGVVIPDTGISMQIQGVGFVLEPGHPNAVDGGKRPYHTIIPGFISHDGKPEAAFGVMGGHMQPQGHLQVLSRLVDGAAIHRRHWMRHAGASIRAGGSTSNRDFHPPPCRDCVIEAMRSNMPRHAPSPSEAGRSCSESKKTTSPAATLDETAWPSGAEPAVPCWACCCTRESTKPATDPCWVRSASDVQCSPWMIVTRAGAPDLWDRLEHAVCRGAP